MGMDYITDSQLILSLVSNLYPGKIIHYILFYQSEGLPLSQFIIDICDRRYPLLPL